MNDKIYKNFENCVVFSKIKYQNDFVVSVSQKLCTPATLGFPLILQRVNGVGGVVIVEARLGAYGYGHNPHPLCCTVGDPVLHRWWW